jgi:hypothetical protein
MTSYIVVTHFGVGRINKVPAEGSRATHEFVFPLKRTPTAPVSLRTKQLENWRRNACKRNSFLLKISGTMLFKRTFKNRREEGGQDSYGSEQ